MNSVAKSVVVTWLPKEMNASRKHQLKLNIYTGLSLQNLSYRKDEEMLFQTEPNMKGLESYTAGEGHSIAFLHKAS